MNYFGDFIYRQTVSLFKFNAGFNFITHPEPFFFISVDSVDSLCRNILKPEKIIDGFFIYYGIAHAAAVV